MRLEQTPAYRAWEQSWVNGPPDEYVEPGSRRFDGEDVLIGDWPLVVDVVLHWDREGDITDVEWLGLYMDDYDDVWQGPILPERIQGMDDVLYTLVSDWLVRL